MGRLKHDFHCKSAADIHNHILAKRVQELKETQEGVEHMCKEMALSLAKMGLSTEKIAEAAKVSVKLVQEWLMGKADLAK